MARRPRHDGDEQDAFSRYWRSALIWKPGQIKKIKRRANKRDRRNAQQDIRKDQDQ